MGNTPERVDPIIAAGTKSKSKDRKTKTKKEKKVKVKKVKETEVHYNVSAGKKYIVRFPRR